MSDPKSPTWSIPDEAIADPIPPIPLYVPPGAEEAIAAAGAEAAQEAPADEETERKEFQALLDFIAANKDPDTEFVAADAADALSFTVTITKE